MPCCSYHKEKKKKEEKLHIKTRTAATPVPGCVCCLMGSNSFSAFVFTASISAPDVPTCVLETQGESPARWLRH